MPKSTASTYPSVNHSLLLLAHVACAEQQGNLKGIEELYELALKTHSCTLEEMEKILSQDSKRLSVEVIARKIPVQQRFEVMRQILAVAHIDGFYTPTEQKLVKQIAELWKISATEIEFMREAAADFAHQAKSADQADKGYGSTCLKKEVPVSPQENGLDQEPFPRQHLLAAEEYQRAIEKCSHIAREDYRYTETTCFNASAALEDLKSCLDQRIVSIKNQSHRSRKPAFSEEIVQQLEQTVATLTTEITGDLQQIRHSLCVKEKALNDFTIAFMGKTKAGKSTLHAILAGGGWDAIGVGMQRTTRQNRVYTWNNIRIIDTPGIGAPGGQTDEEIARSVIDEADVICYVVTDDSIQETEFGFLKTLKEKAKPLMVLLNLKHNLRDARRLENCLKNPDKLFKLDGKSGIQGHFERIRRYAREYYANDYFPIIPVMLLAAQMSYEPEHQNDQDELFQFSQLQDFLESIRLALTDYGTIRRSQTLLSSTVGTVEAPCKWITEQAKLYRSLTQRLQKEHRRLQDNIEQAKQDALNELKQVIKQAFQDVQQITSDFAEEHWQSNEVKMRMDWERNLERIQFTQKLEMAHQNAIQKFNQDVQDTVEEIGRELQLLEQMNDGNDCNFQQQVSFDGRTMFQSTAAFLSAAAAILFFTPLAPLSSAVGLLAVGISFGANLFKTRD